MSIRYEIGSQSNQSILDRARRKEPLAVLMIALAIIFIGVWFVALVFDGSQGVLN